MSVLANRGRCPVQAHERVCSDIGVLDPVELALDLREVCHCGEVSTCPMPSDGDGFAGPAGQMPQPDTLRDHNPDQISEPDALRDLLQFLLLAHVGMKNCLARARVNNHRPLVPGGSAAGYLVREDLVVMRG